MAKMTAAHVQQVAELVAKGAETTGFMKAMEALALGHGTGGRRIVPDAFRVDEKRTTVFAYEVVVTSELTEDKMDRYVQLHQLIDPYGWSLVIVRVAPNGATSAIDAFGYELKGRAA